MKTKRGFTLVELLVVIAVIALLLSILMPALRKAKNQAIRSYCANNAKQIVMGLILYTQENNDYFPWHEVGGCWYWLWGLDWKAAEYLLKTGCTIETFYCPANIQQTRFRQEYWYDWWPDKEHIVGYFMLWDNPPPDDRGWQPYGSGNKRFPVKVTETRPADIELISDVTFSDENNYGPPDFQYGNFVRVGGGMVGLGTYDSTNHVLSESKCEGTNIGYVDGHVNWRPFSEMERRVADGCYPTQWW